MCKMFRKPKLCDKCANLVAKVGREYKCKSGSSFAMYFKRAPSYCVEFKLREEADEQS